MPRKITSFTRGLASMPSTNISLLMQELERDEGRRSKPYRDTEGYLTIGVGHNLDAEGLCEEAINAQLEFDIQRKAIEPVARYCPWAATAPADVQRGLWNLCFNLGITGLLKFKITLGHLQAGRYQQAADALLMSKYAKQVGQRANRIADLWRSVV
jgi:lysozyme